MTAFLQFGQSGNAASCMRAGWSQPEDAFTWSVGVQSELRLPKPPTRGDLRLELHVRPFLPPLRPRQRLTITVNGSTIGREILSTEMILAFTIPASLHAGHDILQIVFGHPDSETPVSCGLGDDTRPLAVAFFRLDIEPAAPLAAITPRSRAPLAGHDRETLRQEAERLTGLTLNDLASAFQSLGHNCEFGLVQRHFSNESLGLLRFVSINPLNLLRGLREGFAPLAEAHNLRVVQLPRDPSQEFIVQDDHFGTEGHSFKFPPAYTAAQVHAQVVTHNTFLLRLLHETLQSGDKILVVQHPMLRSLAAITPIADALQALGPNLLLWVCPDETAPPGGVTLLRPGLLRGTIDRLAPIAAAADSNLLAWTSLLANAHLMRQDIGYRGP